jgi:hypothetical protein
MVLLRQPEREERTPATRDGRSRGLTPTQSTDSGQSVAAARHLTSVVRSRGRQPVKSLLEWAPAESQARSIREQAAVLDNAGRI